MTEPTNHTTSRHGASNNAARVSRPQHGYKSCGSDIEFIDESDVKPAIALGVRHDPFSVSNAVNQQR